MANGRLFWDRIQKQNVHDRLLPAVTHSNSNVQKRESLCDPPHTLQRRGGRELEKKKIEEPDAAGEREKERRRRLRSGRRRCSTTHRRAVTGGS